MKLMPALPETIFDIAYLIFAITTGIVLLIKAKDKTSVKLFGAMTLYSDEHYIQLSLDCCKKQKSCKANDGFKTTQP